MLDALLSLPDLGLPLNAVSPLVPVVAGVAVHSVVHFHEPVTAKAIFATLFLAPLLITLSSHPQSTQELFWMLIKSNVYYLLALSASVTAYRLAPFHPLARYPGPLGARVSRLWALRIKSTGKQHLYADALFKRYGNVVRTGPNHLILKDAAAISVLHGSKDAWHKSGRYNVTTPLGADGALFSLLDPATHARRRKLWDPAFTAEARKVYEPMLVVRVNELVQHLRERAGVPLDLAEWLSLLAMDFMSDFEFSGGLETMRDGADVAGIRRTIEEGLSIQEALGMVPWVRGLITLLPSKKAQDFYDLGLSIAERRRAAGGTSKDLMYHLLGEGDDTRARPPMSRLTFSLEAALALGGGSDTTAVSLANVFFYLLTNPRVFTKLRAALDAAAGEFADFDVDIDLAQLREIPYLEGVINETFRLQPLVASGSPRTPPPGCGGVVVAEYSIPEGTTVQVPMWSLGRDARYFYPDPDAFWPERWTEEGEAIAKARGEHFRLVRAAFSPFSYGPRACIGKMVALQEMRYVLAVLVRHFDFRLADGYKAETWIEQLEDHFTWTHAIGLRDDSRFVEKATELLKLRDSASSTVF